MEIVTREVGNATVLNIVGELNLYNSSEFKALGAKLVSDGKTRLILDLKNVTYVDSTGIGELLNLLKKIGDLRGTLQLIRLTPIVRKVFELTRLTEAFEIYESEEQAMYQNI